MTRERWQRIQDAYLKVMELPPPERPQFLESARTEDADMCRELESFLKCSDKVQHFLERTAIDLVAGLYTANPAVETFEEHDDLVGTVISDRYVVHKRIDSGGSGHVYRAQHRLMDTPVAIKRLVGQLRDLDEHRQRFIEEARRAALLDHENIAKVKDVVEESGEVFVIMEFVDGPTLRDRMGTPMEIDEFLKIAIQIASGLAAAHRERILHLDIKPANIMLTKSQTVKICDFGMSRRLPPKDGQDGAHSPWTFGGTPAYIPPEVLESNRFDERADVFSSGVVFYEMLSGENPFDSEDIRTTTNRILHQDVPLLDRGSKKLPRRLAGLIDAMLKKDPAGRPGSADVLRTLKAIQRRRTFFGDLLRTAKASGRKAVKSRYALPVAALLLALVVSVAVFFRPLYTALVLNPLPEKKSLVVLPFEFAGDSPDTRNYTLGINELLTANLTRLTRIPGLQIVP